jgi:hypothetical protein
MINKLFLILFAALVMAGCHARQHTEEEVVETFDLHLPPDQQGFLENLQKLCGQSFRGHEVYMAEGRESWAHMDFVMHVTVCEDHMVLIPFHLDEDHSRTWRFTAEGGRLRFRHDHRYPDGTPEEQTLYGGYADGEGTPFRQSFPADDYTLELLDNPEYERQWNIVMDTELSTFSYQLQYRGEIVFQADFDLTNPL